MYWLRLPRRSVSCDEFGICGVCEGDVGFVMVAQTVAVARFLSRPASSAALDLEDGVAMPPGLYVSAEIARLERERLFASEWNCVGRAHELGGPDLATALRSATVERK